MATKIFLSDTFKQWLEKINLLNDEVANLSISGGTDLGFAIDVPGSSGLSVRLFSGRIRDGSSVYQLTPTTVLIPSAGRFIICAEKKKNIAPSLTVYEETAVPEKDVVPLWLIVSSASAVTDKLDLRTAIITSSGSGTGDASPKAIVFYEKEVTENTIIPSNYNALSISPKINQGVTVTVSEGSTWAVL